MKKNPASAKKTTGFPVKSPENLTLYHLVRPADLNNHGTLFGGTTLGWMDQAGALAAVKRARSRVLLRQVREANFIKPVYPAQRVALYAQVTVTGRTSITVKLEMWRDSIVDDGQDLVADAEIVYVAIDENARPQPVDRPR